MSTDMTLQIRSTASDETWALGAAIGRNCRGSELILLASDLGGGKTTFTKGLAKGLGSNNTVSSPTFMVSKVYDCRDGLELHHFDFYRLNEGGMVGMELDEVRHDPKAICVIEWGDVVNEQLPDERITIKIDRLANSEDAREITVIYPEKFSYIVEGIV